MGTHKIFTKKMDSSSSSKNINPAKIIDKTNQNASKEFKNHHRYKTALCNSFMNTGKCKHGANCTYAHGMIQLRAPNHIQKAKKPSGLGQFMLPQQTQFFGMMSGNNPFLMQQSI